MLAEIAFQIPLVFSVLLLFAGLLTGVALAQWGQPDGGELEKTLKELQRQNADLHQTLAHQRDAYGTLEQQHAQQREYARALGELQSRLEFALREHELEHSGIEEGLAAIRDVRQRALRDLEEERKTRVQIEARLHAVQQELQQTQDQLHRVATERDAYSSHGERIKLDERRIAELDTRLASLLGKIAETIGWSSAEPPGEAPLLDRLAHVVSRHRELELLADRSREQEQATAVLLRNEQQRRLAAEELLEAQMARFRETHVAIDELEQFQNRYQEASHELAIVRRDQASFQEAIQVLTDERDQGQARLRSAVARVRELEHELESYQRTIETMERHRQQLLLQTDDERQRYAALENSLRGQVELMERFDKAQSELRLARDESLQLRTHAHEIERQLRTVTLEHTTARQQIVDLEEERVRLERQLEAAEKDSDRVRAERESLAQGMNAERKLRESADVELQATRNRLHGAMAQVQDSQQLERELQTTREELRQARLALVEARNVAIQTNSAPVHDSVESSDALARISQLEGTVLVLKEQLRMAQIQVQETLQRHWSDQDGQAMGRRNVEDARAA